MNYHTHTLSNGLRIIHAPNQSAVAYCGFAIDAGTRDEAENEQGMAHFVEHLIFKGTQKRHAWHILNRMEHVGGDLNAYTNKEETVVYSAFLAEHFPRAVELLADIVFHSTFPQPEIDKEVEVIIDEIQSYEDSPCELIFDDFEELIFPHHPLGRNILGKPDLARNLTAREDLILAVIDHGSRAFGVLVAVGHRQIEIFTAAVVVQIRVFDGIPHFHRFGATRNDSPAVFGGLKVQYVNRRVVGDVEVNERFALLRALGCI